MLLLTLLGFSMIELSKTTETKIIHAANESGQTVSAFLDVLLETYGFDRHDIELADQAMKESGEVTLEQLQASYDL